MNKALRWFTAAVIVAMTVSAGSVQAEISPQQKLMARRAAEADAYRKLAERLMGLKISSQTTVRDFATESDKISGSLNEFVKGVRIDEEGVTWYEDGSCEVVAEVTLQKIVTTLKSVCDQYYDGDRWTKDIFEEITRDSSRQVISVVGCGAAMDATHMPDADSLEYVQPLIAGGAKRAKLPAIYLKAGARKRLMAKRAAEMDAYRKLIERVYGLRVDSSTLVRDFVTVADEIRMGLRHSLKGARTGVVCYQADGIVQVQMSLTLDDVVKVLQRNCTETYNGKGWTRDRLEKITTSNQRKTITVVGSGALNMGGAAGGAETNLPVVGSRSQTTFTKVIEETVIVVLD